MSENSLPNAANEQEWLILCYTFGLGLLEDSSQADEKEEEEEVVRPEVVFLRKKLAVSSPLHYQRFPGNSPQ